MERDPRGGSGVEIQSGGVLIGRVLDVLAAGPAHTAVLAERVLGVRGSPPAAAAAVFTLLGTDSRFEVDTAGYWSLAESAPPRTAASLLEEEWVVVDVETTGGSPDHGHRVTEVAAVRVSGGRIVDSFATLVNPERRIPSMITSLTGITNAMVETAPTFRVVADQVAEAIRGRVFVAHNASFDWRFVGAEMERCRQRLEGRQLCTVRLSRKLLPQLPSRSLDSLALFFGLEIEARHRALDDAVATAHVLLRLLEMLAEREVHDWMAVEAYLRRRAPRRKRRLTPRSMDSA